jgi:hypothetical protein
VMNVLELKYIVKLCMLYWSIGTGRGEHRTPFPLQAQDYKGGTHGYPAGFIDFLFSSSNGSSFLCMGSWGGSDRRTSLPELTAVIWVDLTSSVAFSRSGRFSYSTCTEATGTHGALEMQT